MGLFYDYYYIVLVLPAMLIAVAAQIYLKSIYKKMSNVNSLRGLTGAQAAYQVLAHYGITDVRIEQVAGTLSDHFDPRDKVIRLSAPIYRGSSIAAIGIACHEAGHAAQHNQGYLPIKLRNALVPVTNLGSALGIPLALVGFMLGWQPLITFGLVLYAAIAVFQLVTLPVEFNASRRAIRVIDETNLLEAEEQLGAKQVLVAAALTYVAALVVSLANLLRLILRFNSRRN
ncbi:MAG: zinc metallopeptidase [Clostridiales bacterium]|nr:zinc metallopeptidase [Clostridiales bacterium]